MASGTFDGSGNLSLTAALKNSGAKAGGYGPGANATPAFNATFSVPQITVDAKGRVTAAVTRTVKIPANPVMTKATASAAGKAGLVPAPAAGAQGKCLQGDGTWGNPQYADSAGYASRAATTTGLTYTFTKNSSLVLPVGGTWFVLKWWDGDGGTASGNWSGGQMVAGGSTVNVNNGAFALRVA